ncbi:MAG: VWA domain-containing protein [Candidatus Marinimicrobia bacterium]|nr:VWA domain-containing protein [Candidatus Neomarinimicrobiota bacterium]MCF7829710.1 VWA domain-containing protein [Candidatus Neomarinimicrobiota bacterium]MCF7881660.1 VWA domain-containing protein [Candidatus Neomarinimicrobiota bacterium]
MFRFQDPWFLVLLAGIPLLIWWYLKAGRNQYASLQYSTLQILKSIQNSRRTWKQHLSFALRSLGIILLILGLARPQLGNAEREVTSEGIDIMMVLDISSSMRAVDFKPNRLEAAKRVAADFISDRHSDRIGLVVFAGESFLQCPLTIDYDVLTNFIQQVEIIDEKYDGTAIGMAMANAINRLRESPGEDPVIILLSDGRNNAGELDPLTAANMAESYGIKVYTIGAGKEGEALYPVDTQFGQRYMSVQVQIDEESLQEIAEITGGKYFRAEDEQSLATIYEEISQLEKTEYKVKEYTNWRELFPWFLIPAFALLLGERVLASTKLRSIP